MEARNIYLPVASRVVRVTDIGGTFVFAIQGGLAAVLAHLDPVGVVVLSFLSALGGGVMRDLLIGARPIAAIGNWRYMAIVLAASATIWAFHSTIRDVPFLLMAGLGAVGLSLFAVAGTQKALDYEVNPFVADFSGHARRGRGQRVARYRPQGSPKGIVDGYLRKCGGSRRARRSPRTYPAFATACDGDRRGDCLFFPADDLGETWLESPHGSGLNRCRHTNNMIGRHIDRGHIRPRSM